MIDVISDELIEVRKIASTTFGNRIHPNTCYRWASKGSGGVKLEAVKIGRKWFTTETAFRSFCESQTQNAMKPETSPAREKTNGIPDDCTEAELRACGLL